MESRENSSSKISKSSLLFWGLLASIFFGVFAFNAYQAWMSYRVFTSDARPPRPVFPEWVLSLAPSEQNPKWIKLPERWVSYGDWQMPHCPLIRPLLPRSQVCYRQPELVVAFNRAESETLSFEMKPEQGISNRVRSFLIVTCDESVTSVALAINSRHPPVDWWETIAIVWETDITAGESTWSYNPNAHGTGIWKSSDPEALFKHLVDANQLTLKLSPPDEEQITALFGLNGIDHVDSLMRRHCPAFDEVSLR